MIRSLLFLFMIFLLILQVSVRLRQGFPDVIVGDSFHGLLEGKPFQFGNLRLLRAGFFHA